MPSFRSLLAYLETTAKKIFYLGIEFFVFQDRKLELFQHLFEIEFREFYETSQKLNLFSSFRQLLFSFFLSVV